MANHEVDPDAPYDFRNSDPSAFASASMPVYLDAPAGEPVDLEVPISLHPEELQSPAARYLVGFNLHDDVVRLTDVAVTRDGKLVAFERDERSSTLQPRLIIPGDALPRSEPVELLLTGTATASEDGRIHVGALAIAFDAGWGTLRTSDGGAAQAYAFTLLMSDGHATTGLAPRFHGEGNSAVALVPLLGMVSVTAFGLRAAWRRLHAPPTKEPTPTATPGARRTTPQPAPPMPAPAQATRPRPAPAIPGPPAAAESAPLGLPPEPPATFIATSVEPGVAAFPRLVADPLASRPARTAALPVAVKRRKRLGSQPVVQGSPLRNGYAVAEPPLAMAASKLVARPPRPARAGQVDDRREFEVLQARSR